MGIDSTHSLGYQIQISSFKRGYSTALSQLKGNTSTKNPQLSTSDPDSRHQIVRGMITEVCYTAQTTVDAKYKLLIDYKLSNQNDKKAMGMMLRRTKSILRTNSFTALYDKGYHIKLFLGT